MWPETPLGNWRWGDLETFDVPTAVREIDSANPERHQYEPDHRNAHVNGPDQAP